MQQLFSSGAIADIILAVMAAEAALIILFARPRGPLAFAALLGNLAAGASLVVALRLALTGSDWPPIAGALLASMVGHSTDLYARLNARS